MPLTTAEILEFLFGKDEAKNFDTIDKVKEKFAGEQALFIPAAELTDSKSESFKRFMPKAVGQQSGKTLTALKKRLAEFEVELSPDEIKEKPLEDIVDIALSKAAGNYKTKVTDYENRLKSTATDAVKEWETKHTALNQKYNDLKTLHDSLKTTYDTTVASHDTEMKGIKKNTIVDRYHNEHVKFKKGVTDLEREGYFSTLNKKFKVELNDKGDDIEVYDRGTNSRIENKKQAGTFKSYKDVLEEVGVQNNVWAINEGAGRMNRNNFNFADNNQSETGGGSTNSQPDSATRKVSSRIAQ